MISWWGDYLVVCVNLCLLGFTVLESPIPSVSSVFLSRLSNDFYRNFNKIHASKETWGMRRKPNIIQSVTKIQGVELYQN